MDASISTYVGGRVIVAVSERACRYLGSFGGITSQVSSAFPCDVASGEVERTYAIAAKVLANSVNLERQVSHLASRPSARINKCHAAVRGLITGATDLLGPE
jgi:hypothetical protein